MYKKIMTLVLMGFMVGLHASQNDIVDQQASIDKLKETVKSSFAQIGEIQGTTEDRELLQACYTASAQAWSVWERCQVAKQSRNEYELLKQMIEIKRQAKELTKCMANLNHQLELKSYFSI